MPDLFDILTTDIEQTSNIDIATDHPDWTPVANLVTPTRASGTYRIDIAVIWSLDTTTKSGMIRYSIDGGATWKEFQSEPKDKTNDNGNDFGFTLIGTAEQAWDIQVEMTKESGTATMTCSSCEISLRRVG